MTYLTTVFFSVIKIKQHNFTFGTNNYQKTETKKQKRKLDPPAAEIK